MTASSVSHCPELFQVSHREACNEAPPEPDGLARWLFGMELEHDCPDSVNVAAYKDLLGPAGLGVYRGLVETAWAELPPEPDRGGRPGFFYGEADHRRWALGHMLEELAALHQGCRGCQPDRR
jgi:hypothetical protein